MAYRHYRIREYYDSLKAEGKPAPQMKTASQVSGLATWKPMLTRDRFLSVQEVMAMPELGADNITVGAPLLSDLVACPAMPRYKPGRWHQAIRDTPDVEFESEPWRAPGQEAAARRAKVLAGGDPAAAGKAYDADVETKDYLAEGVLDEANQKDDVTRVRLEEALKRFSQVEDESKRFIQALQASLA